MPKHSIIIPHRDYHDALRVCIASIDYSAKHCGITDYEIIIVDSSPAQVLPNARHVCVFRMKPGGFFNKPQSQNRGIAVSSGEVFSFIDADAIVGPKWMECAGELPGMPSITKMCYRVRLLPPEVKAESIRSEEISSFLDYWFSRYDQGTQRAHEGYGAAETNVADREELFQVGSGVFGNSHFSITREKLGGIRFNEDYRGRGYEDLWMNREIARRHGDKYCGMMVTDPEHAILSLRYKSKDKTWGPGPQNERNAKMYAES